MTKEQIEKLDLGISPVDARTALMVESAFNWINDNTSHKIDCNDDLVLEQLGANAKLFIIKYVDVMAMSAGVTSESLGGMSQSFDSATKTDLLWQYAYELLGDSLRSQFSFTSAKRRWY